MTAVPVRATTGRPPVARAARPAVRGSVRCSAVPIDGGRVRLVGSSTGPVHPVHHPTPRGPDVLLLTTDTAGLAAGDSLDVQLSVASGAQLVLSDPAPTQLLPGVPGATGCMTTGADVAAGGGLVLLPHALVPLRRSRSRVGTVVRVQPGARAAIGGVIAPGRVACGEVWEAGRLDSTTDMLVGGELVARDALRVEGPRPSLVGVGHLVSLLVYGAGDAAHLGRVREVAGPTAGVCALSDDLLALRAVVDSQRAAAALLCAVLETVRPELAGWGWGRIGYDV